MPKTNNSEPSLSAAQFSQRCSSLALKFAGVIGLRSGDVAFSDDLTSSKAAMTLCGRASEKVNRNRGSAHFVVPLAEVSEGVFMWVGYRELWDRPLEARKFHFVEGGFTVHVGKPGELNKPQIFRNEWVGQRSAGFVQKAGHPHWQFDALETCRLNQNATVERFQPTNDEGPVQEFKAQESVYDTSQTIVRLTVENMHLASSASWWRKPEEQIAHQPKTEKEVDQWILGCLLYMRQEATRCKLTSRF